MRFQCLLARRLRQRKANSVAKRSSFLLRIDPKVLNALRKWADDELRSVNGQIEFILKNAVQQAGRWDKPSPPKDDSREDADTD